MAVQKIRPGVHLIASIDWDRRLFDELIPLPEGTSYNSYLVKGENKTALIDTADPRTEKEFLHGLEELDEKIDYVISNHAEQDHSGSIPLVLDLYPDAKVVTNEKCKKFLSLLLHVPEERFQVVGDGDTLELGGRTMEFIKAPWVHWPETMLTYLREERILFPCDFFGSHYATSETYVRDKCHVYSGAKRYYAEIMMPFRNNIRNHLKRLEDYNIDIIAPSHGPLYDKPEFIIDAYRDWVSDRVKNEAVIAYVSMHGSTRAMVERLTDSLVRLGVEVKLFNLSESDVGELAMALVDAATLVVGTPTVHLGPHPYALNATYLANILRPKTRFASVVGSYGWGGKTVNTIKDMIPNLKVELLDPVYINGHPMEKDFKELDRLARDIYEKHKELDIIEKEE